MAEIYRDSTTTGIVFGVTEATVTKAEFYRNGELLDTAVSGATVSVPYSVTKDNGQFDVKWYYTLATVDYVRTETHEVVTPLFTQTELTAWDNDFSTLSAEASKRLESQVRRIIQVYTGQDFGFRSGSTTAKGNGASALYLNDRLLEIDSVNGTPYSTYAFSIEGDGYVLSTAPNYSAVVSSGVPIGDYTPYRFKSGKKYTIFGKFGFYTVPEEVKQAALYLAEAFTCDESLWRERFIKSVRAADWRFDFSEEAFRSTGSLPADQLLDPFVRFRGDAI